MMREVTHIRVKIAVVIVASVAISACAKNHVEEFDYYSREHSFGEQFWQYVGTSGIQPNWADASLSDLQNVTHWFPYDGGGPYAARITCMDLAMEKIRQEGGPASSETIGKAGSISYWTTRHRQLCSEHKSDHAVRAVLHQELADLYILKSEKMAASFGEY